MASSLRAHRRRTRAVGALLGGGERSEKVPRDAAARLLVQLDEGELRRPVDPDQEVKPAFAGMDLGDVDVEAVDRIALELATRRFVALDIRQMRDAVALQAAVQGRARQMWDCRLQGVQAVLELSPARRTGRPRAAEACAVGTRR